MRAVRHGVNGGGVPKCSSNPAPQPAIPFFGLDICKLSLPSCDEQMRESDTLLDVELGW